MNTGGDEEFLVRPLPAFTRLDRRARSNRRALRRAVVLALTLGLLYLLAGRMGGDLSAQIAHADFAADHPVAVVDFRWFGGTQPLGYSLWTPPVMALLGVRVTGVLATVAAVTLFGLLLRRVGAPRQRLACAAAAITFTSDLAEGRVTFACGLAVGLAALLVLARHEGRGRLASGAALSLLAAAASPVVALYLLLAAATAILHGRRAIGAALGAAVLPLLLTSVVFGDAGRQVFSANDAVRALLATALVLVLTPRRHALLRTGALLAFVMVLLAWLVPTPVGSNSTRLSLLFAVPLTAAYVRFPRPLGALCVVLVAVVQPPITFGTLTGAGRPVTNASYFSPLSAELATLGPLTGRVEVPELTGHWDAAYLARDVPLSRGWLRQLDTHLNDDVFYRHLPTAQSYRQFLDRTATEYIAVADARPTFYGRRERTLIGTGLPYLKPVWRNQHWTLYAVDQPVPIVAAPGALSGYGASQIRVQAPADSDVTVEIRWLRWLSLSGPAGACLRRDGDVVVLHAARAGTYTIGSTVFGDRRHC